MTYKQLIEKLQALPPARLNDDIAIYNTSIGEFQTVHASDIATDIATDILDEGHFYLVVQDNE